MSSCLLIVDVQKGFINESTKHIPDCIGNLIKEHRYDHIVASKYVNNEDSPHYKLAHWDGLMDRESQALCEVVSQNAEMVFEKNINSCFTDEFEAFVVKEQVSIIHIVGIDTDCCVMKTAFDCFDKGMPFKVLIDYCASSGGTELHKAAEKIMMRSLGKCNIVRKI